MFHWIIYQKKSEKCEKPVNRFFENCRFFCRTSKLISFSELAVSKTPGKIVFMRIERFRKNFYARIGRNSYQISRTREIHQLWKGASYFGHFRLILTPDNSFTNVTPLELRILISFFNIYQSTSISGEKTL